MKANLATLVVGVLFGFTLGWAQLYDPAVSYAMLRLREPDVFLLMGIAIATAALGARVLRAFGARALFENCPVSWKNAMPTRDHVVGSVLFGLAWSVTCVCPGPIAVQLGRGEWFGGFMALGLMAGIAVHDALKGAARTPAEMPREAVGAASPGL